MKTYQSPTLRIRRINKSDIIITSSENPGGDISDMPWGERQRDSDWENY